MQRIANKMGVSDDELRQHLANRMPTREHEMERSSAPMRTSLYGISILLSMLIGMTYVINIVIRHGIKQAIFTLTYVAFCLFMISSKRLLEKRVGTYYIGTGIHLPPAHPPAWKSVIFLGWILLLLPVFLIVLNTVVGQ